MWRLILAAMRRSLRITNKSSSRVADENIAAGEVIHRRSRSRWKITFLCGIVMDPFSHTGSYDQANGVDGVWMSADFPQTSEISHLMVRDSLRFSILM